MLPSMVERGMTYMIQQVYSKVDACNRVHKRECPQLYCNSKKTRNNPNASYRDMDKKSYVPL